MANVLIRGPLLTQSGYGVHSRQIFRWAVSAGHNVKVQLLPWGITPWFTNGEYLGGLVGEIMERSGDSDLKFDYSIQVQLPNEWDNTLAKKNIGVTALVETDKCNPAWVNDCYRMDHVIVPTNFTAKVLKNSGHNGKDLSVITECYYDECEEEDLVTPLPELKTGFNFLLFGQITGSPDSDRKNTFQTMRWFCEKFKGRKDVGLIVKTNMGTNSIMDRKASLNSIQHYVKQIGLDGQNPKIYLLHGYLSPGEVAGLYKDSRVKCLISGTRGEGFGLPMLEAAASKLPVIATNWSGHKDFLDKGKWLPVDYDLVRIPNERVDGSIFVEGARWAEPQEKSFKYRLDKFYKNRGVPDSWTDSLSEEIRKHHSFDAACLQYDNLLSRV